MARKTAAEMSRDYRRRKKEKLGEEWMQKERDRVKQYYVSSSELKSKDLKTRREKIRQRVQVHRARKRLFSEDGHHLTRATTSDLPSTLTVKMNFHSESEKKKGTRTRVSRAVAKAHRRISSLENTSAKYQRKAWKLQKKLQRLRRVTSKKYTDVPRSPQSKADYDLKKAGLDPRKHLTLRKKLTAHNALMAQLKQKATSRKNLRKQELQELVAGNITRRYRLLRHIGRETSLNRNKFSRENVSKVKRRLPLIRSQLASLVEDFYKRDDNSHMMPGKKDFTKVNKMKKQSRVLTDYLCNLWSKFQSENPHKTLSLSVFCKMRPPYVKLTNFMSRKTCLCIYHQNFTLLLRAARIFCSPDALIAERRDEDIIEMLSDLDDQITYYTWKNADTEGKSRMKCVSITTSKDDYVSTIRDTLIRFRKHVATISSQYKAVRELKSRLTPKEAVIQMDFSENMTCRTVEEVQSAYWSQEQVSIHPVVVYYVECGSLQHKSMIFLSDSTAHNTSAVLAILQKLNEQLKDLLPQVDTYHFITDSPVSQYRNRIIFHIVGNCPLLFGVKCTWLYHEVGHGKGPCDGLGGTLKRHASEAVHQGKVIIQDAKDLYAWASRLPGESIKYIFYSSEDVEAAQCRIQKMTTKSVKGTFDLHAVVYVSPGKVAVRNTACLSPCCYGHNMPFGCDGWTVVDVGEEKAPPLNLSHLVDGAWVAAEYLGKWYLGQILDTDVKDEEYLINFLQKTWSKKAMQFKWPKQKDLLWRGRMEILCVIPSPTAVGNHFEISAKTHELIQECFSKH